MASTTPQTQSWLERERAIVLAGIAVIAALAWAYVAYRSNGGSGGGAMSMEDALTMPATDSGAAGYTLLFGMWAVMMVAMMTPSAAPMILTYTAIVRSRRQRQDPYVPTGVFVAGYLVVWSGFGAAAALAQWGFQSADLISGSMRVSGGIAAAVLIAAGLYQWSPLKRVCLTQCRTPLSFLMTGWREGRGGAVLMGVRHGLYCLGCCWVLMGLLFVGGVMNTLWVAAIAAFVLAEKTVPGPVAAWLSRVTGAALVVWGVWAGIAVAT